MYPGHSKGHSKNSQNLASMNREIQIETYDH